MNSPANNMIDNLPESKVSQWRSTWLKENMASILTWDDLKGRVHKNGQDEQFFWRADPRTSRPLDDNTLVSKGALVHGPGGSLIHVAYVPWVYPDGTPGKEAWDKDAWAKFEDIVTENYRANRSQYRGMEWNRLTISKGVSKLFFEGKITESHFCGEDFSEAISGEKLTSNLIEGNVTLSSVNLSHTCILGIGLVSSRSFRATDVKAKRISFSAHEVDKYDIEISGSSILEFILRGGVKSLTVLGSEVFQFDASDTQIGSIVAVGSFGEALGLNLENSIISGRVNFTNVSVGMTAAGCSDASFQHTKFSEKVLCANSNFNLSVFADSQLEEPIDIRFQNSTPEDVFERELSAISRLTSADFESARSRLEGACQLICDRHRQDGRKDLEHRFRRLEIKARSRRLGADRSAKLLNWFYDRASDFGLSVWRPIIGIASIWVLFTLVYWSSAAIDQGAALSLGLPLDQGLFTHSVLMSTDKLFPFGTSVDEAKLFGGKFVGEAGGASAVLIGFVGAIQTLLSGVMIFLAGLAVRTRLLIG